MFLKSVATLIDREYSSEHAAAQLGHSGIAITEKHYIAIAAETPDLTKALEQFGGPVPVDGPTRETTVFVSGTASTRTPSAPRQRIFANDSPRVSVGNAHPKIHQRLATSSSAFYFKRGG